MFYPFFNSGFNRSNIVDRFGIPVMRTISVTTDTTNNTVTYGICPKLFRQLPDQGLFLLHIVNKPSGTTTGFNVSLNGSCIPTVVTASTTTITGARPLIDDSGTQVTSSIVTLPNRYLVYYNKCSGVFQLVNHITASATTAQ